MGEKDVNILDSDIVSEKDSEDQNVQEASIEDEKKSCKEKEDQDENIAKKVKSDDVIEMKNEDAEGEKQQGVAVVSITDINHAKDSKEDFESLNKEKTIEDLK